LDDLRVQPGTTTGVDLSEGYRETQLGPLPEEWDVVQLQEVTDEIISGDWGAAEQTPNLIAVNALRGTDFARAAKGSLDEVPTRYLKKRSIDKRQIRPGDALVELSGGSKDQPTGRVLLVPHVLLRQATKPVVFSNFVKCLRVNQEVFLPEFFGYLWTSLYARGRTRIYEKRTTGIRNFKLADFLKNEWVQVPSREEQQAIVHILRTVQKAIETTEQVIESTRELKRSLMDHLFTYGSVSVDEAERVPVRETPYGMVPSHWDKMALGDCAYVQTGVTKGRKLEGEKTVEVPYLRVANVQDGYLVLSEIKHIRIREREVERYILREGDVLLTEGGDFDKLGRGFVWRGQIQNCVHQNHVFAVRTGGEILLPEYLAYLIQSRYGKAYFLEVAHRTTNLASINSTKLKAFPVLVPPFFEQEEIIRILETVDEKIAAEENRKKTLDILFKTLLHNLMTGKVRVHDLDLPEVEEVV
jgi:restriction endonuclease S subunit